jgi:hypothetical protein
MSYPLFIFTESLDHLVLCQTLKNRPDTALVSAVEEEEWMNMEIPHLVSYARPDYRDIEVTPREMSSLQGYAQKISKNITKKQALLNVFILGAISVAAGWLGVLLNNLTGDPKLALLAFLAVPPLGILALKTFNPDRKLDLGLEFQLKKNWFIYLCAFLIFPFLTMVVLFTGRMTGFTTFTGLLEKGFGAYFSLVVISFFSDFIKNCLEEFTWRGFFSRQFEAAGAPAMLNHLLTGTVWMLWQVPYWLLLFGPSASAPPSLTAILMVCLSFLTLSVVYGEIRLLSRSTWPAVFMRASLNAVTIPLILHGFVSVQPSAAVWLSPESGSIAYILLFVITGIVLYRIRVNQKTAT